MTKSTLNASKMEQRSDEEFHNVSSLQPGLGSEDLAIGAESHALTNLSQLGLPNTN